MLTTPDSTPSPSASAPPSSPAFFPAAPILLEPLATPSILLPTAFTLLFVDSDSFLFILNFVLATMYILPATSVTIEAHEPRTAYLMSCDWYSSRTFPRSMHVEIRNEVLAMAATITTEFILPSLNKPWNMLTKKLRATLRTTNIKEGYPTPHQSAYPIGLLARRVAGITTPYLARVYNDIQRVSAG